MVKVMNSESFVLYESVFSQMERIEHVRGKEAAYDFIQAICEYGLYDIVPNDENEVWLYGLEQSFTSINAAKNRYNKAVENGKLGGRERKISREEVKKLKDEGYTNKQIAEQLGCSISSVEKINAELKKSDNADAVKTAETHNNLNNTYNDNDNDNNTDNDNDNDSGSVKTDTEVLKDLGYGEVEYYG